MFDELNTFLDNKSNGQAEATNSLYTLSPTVPNVLDLFYKNLSKLGYNLDELKPALEQGGDSLIISCAGSGKTTFLELKLIHDYLSGELLSTRMVNTSNGVVEQHGFYRVFISTFLKTGAEELKTAFNEKCTELHVQGINSEAFSFSTLHAEYYDILKSIGVKVQIMPEEDCMDCLKRCCKSLSIRNRTRMGGGEISKDELSDIACIVTYARNRIDDMRYKHPLCEEYGLTAPLLEKLIELYKKMRVAVNSYDFEDLQEIVYNGIKTNPQFADYVKARYDYVFIDEFQDTSQIQYEILKAYIDGANKTVAIGDDDQCIYSWRGSDVNIITKNFPEDYNPAIHKFTINYRCRSNILMPVVPSIKRNSNRHEKDLNAYKPGGVVDIKKTCNVDDLMVCVRTALAQQHNVGILSRTNFDLLAPAILLELDGSIPFSLSKSVGMSSYIPRRVFGCIKLITRRYTEEFTDLLSMFCSRYNSIEAKKLANILKNQDEMSLYNISDEDLAYSTPELWRNLLKPMREAADGKAAYINMLSYMIQNVFTGTSPFNIRARIFASFVMDLVNNHHSLQNLSLDEIDELFTDAIPTRLNKRAYSKKNTNTQVRLTTVHEAKGKEWKSVILWNDTDGVFPAVVGKHTPTPAEYEEERRLHYIAFTRAKECLTVFTSETNPSPFLKECDFSLINTSDISISNAVDPVSLDKMGTVSITQSIADTFANLLNTGTDEVQTKARNLMSYFEYDTTKLYSELETMYNTLGDSGQLSGAGGDFGIEVEWCIDSLLYSIMQSHAANS